MSSKPHQKVRKGPQSRLPDVPAACASVDRASHLPLRSVDFDPCVTRGNGGAGALAVLNEVNCRHVTVIGTAPFTGSGFAPSI